MSIKQSINQSINQSISQSVSESITTEITQNTSLGNVIWVKEHAINKIPIIMSVCKFKIMRSRAKTVTIYDQFSLVGGGGGGEMDYIYIWPQCSTVVRNTVVMATINVNEKHSIFDFG